MSVVSHKDASVKGPERKISAREPQRNCGDWVPAADAPVPIEMIHLHVQAPEELILVEQ